MGVERSSSDRRGSTAIGAPNPGRRASLLPAALSAIRFVMAATWGGLFASGYRGAAGLGTLAISAALSDLLDGWAARWMGAAGSAGQWLDNLADITFVLTALGCEVWAGAIPAYVPILIALSFAQYAIDSIVIGTGGRSAPIKSRLGHWGGIVNFALVIALGLSPPPGYLGTIVQKISPALAMFYLAAIAERAIGYLRRAG